MPHPTGSRHLHGATSACAHERASHRRFEGQLALRELGVHRRDERERVLASGVLVAHSDSGAECDDVGRWSRLLHVGAHELVAEGEDLGLEERLGVLGVVVLGVLLEVAELAGGLDALGDFAAAFAFETLELALERLVAFDGHDYGVRHRLVSVGLGGDSPDASGPMDTIGTWRGCLRGQSFTCCAAPTEPSTPAGRTTSLGGCKRTMQARRAAIREADCPWSSHARSRSRTRRPPAGRRRGSSGCHWRRSWGWSIRRPLDPRLTRIRRLALLERSWLTVGLQDEDFDPQVGIRVVVAHEAHHRPPGQILDHLARLGPHDLLEPPPREQNLLGVAGVDQRALAPRERVLQHDQDMVAPDGRARLGRPSAGVLAQQVHHPIRDADRELTACRPPVALAGHRQPLSRHPDRKLRARKPGKQGTRTNGLPPSLLREARADRARTVVCRRSEGYSSSTDAWPFSDGRGDPATFSNADVLNRLRTDLEAISARATSTRRRLQRGEALTGMTGLIDIDNLCRDALALLDTARE